MSQPASTIATTLAAMQHRTVSYRDAEVLLAHALTCSRTHLHTHPEQPLTPAQVATFESLLQRREQNEPVAYITGSKEFYGRPFKCDARALIPRPETEGVIDESIKFLEPYFKAHLAASNLPCPLHILELGTGVGNIAVSLALELAERHLPATILATDVSPEALELAQENATLLGAGTDMINLNFLAADLFNHRQIAGPYDLITANLPYVSTTWKMNPAAQPDVVFHEPDIALFGGEDGLTHYRNFFAQAPKYLAPGGAIILEYGEDQTPEFLELAHAAFPAFKLTVLQDYAGLDRVLTILPN